jgi:hypothetical protein
MAARLRDLVTALGELTSSFEPESVEADAPSADSGGPP